MPFLLSEKIILDQKAKEGINGKEPYLFFLNF